MICFLFELVNCQIRNVYQQFKVSSQPATEGARRLLNIYRNLAYTIYVLCINKVILGRECLWLFVMYVSHN